MKRRLLLALWTSLGLWACSRDRDLPEPYRRLMVPPGLLDSAEARENGRRLFLTSCALCHGEKADGRGVRREGLHGTPMPGWKSFTDAQTWDLAAFLLSETH